MKSATGFLSETETELVVARIIFNTRLKRRSEDFYLFIIIIFFSFFFKNIFFNDLLEDVLSWTHTEHTEAEQCVMTDWQVSWQFFVRWLTRRHGGNQVDWLAVSLPGETK